MSIAARLCFKSTRAAFTLVELLVTIVIIVALVALLLPALGRARISSHLAATKMNLNTFGRGFAIVANEDGIGQLVSGAFDWYRDGDVREVGWVHDLIETGLVVPGEALDPGNPHRVNEIVLDYAGIKEDEAAATHWWEDTYGNLNHSVLEVPDSLIEIEEIYEDGYNTNFATSWQLVRGDPIKTSRTSGLKRAQDGTGPVCLGELSSVIGGPARVPLLSLARAGNVRDATLSSDPSSAPMSTSPNASLWSGNTTRQESLNQALGNHHDARTNFWCTESFCDGMTALDTRTGAPSGSPKNLVHNYHDFWPHYLAKREDIDVGGVTLMQLTGGTLPFLSGAFHVGFIMDTDGINGQPDGWIGAYPTAITSNDFDSFIVDDNVENEIGGILDIGIMGV